MVEWTVCPHCQLKHSARGDGLCPRCQQPVVAGAAAIQPGAVEEPLPQLPQPLPHPQVQPAKSGGGPAKWVIGAFVAIVVVIGLQGMGKVSVSQRIMSYRFGLGDEPVTQVDGKAIPYQLTFPTADPWYLRSEESARKDNAVADRWAVRPDKNAHVVVIAEEVRLGPDQVLDMNKLETFVIDNMRKSVEKYTVHETDPVSLPIPGRRIHGTAVIKNVDVELYHALFIKGERIYQVLAFTDKKYFGEMRGELDQVISRMRLP